MTAVIIYGINKVMGKRLAIENKKKVDIMDHLAGPSLDDEVAVLVDGADLMRLGLSFRSRVRSPTPPNTDTPMSFGR